MQVGEGCQREATDIPSLPIHSSASFSISCSTLPQAVNARSLFFHLALPACQTFRFPSFTNCFSSALLSLLFVLGVPRERIVEFDWWILHCSAHFTSEHTSKCDGSSSSSFSASPSSSELFCSTNTTTTTRTTTP